MSDIDIRDFGQEFKYSFYSRNAAADLFENAGNARGAFIRLQLLARSTELTSVQRADMDRLSQEHSTAWKEFDVPGYQRAGIVDIRFSSGFASHAVLAVPPALGEAVLERAWVPQEVPSEEERQLRGLELPVKLLEIPLPWLQKGGLGTSLSAAHVNRFLSSKVFGTALEYMSGLYAQQQAVIPPGLPSASADRYFSNLLALNYSDYGRDADSRVSPEVMKTFWAEMGEVARACVSARQSTFFLSALNRMTNDFDYFDYFGLTADRYLLVANTVRGLDTVESWLNFRDSKPQSIYSLVIQCLEFGAFPFLRSHSGCLSGDLWAHEFRDLKLIEQVTPRDLVILMKSISEVTEFSGPWYAVCDEPEVCRARLQYLGLCMKGVSEYGFSAVDMCQRVKTLPDNCQFELNLSEVSEHILGNEGI